MDGNKNQFCSYCYIRSDALQKCGKCRKRLYCSRECQRKDWKSNGSGGSHKLYCGISGEINIDYEIRPTGQTSVGDGIFALRDFKKDEVIFVERPILKMPNMVLSCHVPDIPESAKHMVDALMPQTGTLRDKLDRNCISCSDSEKEVDGGTTGLFLLLSKANHCCLGNSDHQYLNHRGMKILVSSRSIAKGEEIKFSYVMESCKTKEERQRKLSQYPYLFQCKCVVCTTPSIEKKLGKVKELDDAIFELGGHGKVEMVQRMGKTLLALYDELGMSSWLYQRTYYDLFQMSITKRKFVSEGRRYIDLARKAILSFTKDDQHPEAIRFADLYSNPHHHRNYLIL